MENIANDDRITRKDLLDLEERLIEKLVSKEEFEQKTAELVTKEELRQEVAKLATKEELKQETAKLATREAVDVLAIQVLKNTNDIADIKTELKTINLRLDRMQDRIEKMDDKINRLDEKMDYKFNMVLDAVDTVLKEITDYRTEQVAIHHALFRHDERFEGHEIRIQTLERRAV